MDEIAEIIAGKNKEQLIKELNFQIKNGESLGGTICSTILAHIPGDLWTVNKREFYSSNIPAGIKFR